MGFGVEGASLEVDDPGLVGCEDDAVGAADMAVDDNGGFVFDTVARIEITTVTVAANHSGNALDDGLCIAVGDMVLLAKSLDNGLDVVGYDDVRQQVVNDDAKAAAVGVERCKQGAVLVGDAHTFFPFGE